MAFLIDEIIKSHGIGSGRKGKANGLALLNSDGDVVKSNGELTAPLKSVNGYTGTPVLTYTDVGAAPLSHNHTLSHITDSGTAASKDVGTGSGQVPILGSDGKLNVVVLPPLSISDTHVANSEAEMLALVAQRGDIAIRLDAYEGRGTTFILQTEPATDSANWRELISPVDLVKSVNGKQGVVVLTNEDVGAETAAYTRLIRGDFDAHAADGVRHVTQTNKDQWNNSKFTVGTVKPSEGFWYKVIG